MNVEDYNKDSFHALLLERIQKFTEDYLTTELIIPLFKALGFCEIDYHGGPYEEGKDIIFWREDEIDQVELAVAQVKKFKTTAKSSGGRAFSEVVNQLQQAAEKKVPNLDGQKYYPNIIYFITPYEIDTRSLQSRFEGYQALRKERVKIIDGNKLIKLSKKYNENIINKIAGKELLIHKISKDNLSNEELKRALNYSEKIDISNFYSDLHFGMGKHTTEFFFSMKFSTTTTKVKCKEEDWKDIKLIREEILSKFNAEILTESIEAIEGRYIKESTALSILKSKIKSLNKTIRLKKDELEDINIKLDNELRVIKNKCKNFISENNFIFEDFLRGHHYKTGRTEQSQKEKEKREDQVKEELKIEKTYISILEDYEDKLLLKKYKSILRTKHTSEIDIPKLIKEINRYKVFANELEYTFNIQGKDLSIKVIEKRKNIKESIENFNNNIYETYQLRNFITECNLFFTTFKRIVSNKWIKESIGISENQRYSSPPRLSIPIQRGASDVYGII